MTYRRPPERQPSRIDRAPPARRPARLLPGETGSIVIPGEIPATQWVTLGTLAAFLFIALSLFT